MQNILITGGAGFIGTNLTAELLQRGANVVVVDDFKNAYAKNINKLKLQFKNLQVFKTNCCNIQTMEDIVKNFKFDTLIHLAAKKYVFESFAHSKAYMQNNMNSLSVSLALAEKYNIQKIVFASSITVYGETHTANVKENRPYAPTSPYAKTKQLGEEKILDWQAHNKDKTAIIFRFTNPTSANTKYMLGNNPKKKKLTLTSVVVDSVLNGTSLKLNGNNHPTPDGTPVRDYIHITDLARIVCDVVEKTNKAGIEILNVGCGGNGYSVLQVVNAVENATNKKVNYTFGSKIEGDIAYIVCDNNKLINKYGKQTFADIEQMVNEEFAFRKYLKDNACKK